MPIPTFNPGQAVTVRLDQVPKFEPSGARAEGQMWGDVSQEMDQVAHMVGEIDRQQVLDQQERAGMKAGAQPDFNPQQLEQVAATSADRVWRKAASASYLSKLDINGDAAMAKINAESGEDPEKLNQRLNEYIDGIASTMPETVALQYRDGASRTANAYYTNAVSSQVARDRGQHKADIIAGLELSEAKLKDMGAPDSPEAEKAQQLEAAKYAVRRRQAVEAGVLTENQLAVREQALQQDMTNSTIFQAVRAAPDKLDFALKLANGQSGLPGLDNLPADTRRYGVQVAQQLINEQNATEAIQKKQRLQQASEIITTDGEAIIDTPWAADMPAKAQQLETLALTPDAVDYVGKLRAYVANPSDERFTVMNGDTTVGDYLDYKAARGELSSDDVNTAWGNEQVNSRIDTATRKKLQLAVKGIPDQVVGSTAWKTYVARLETEFPVPDRSMSPKEAMLMQLWGHKPSGPGGLNANGLTDAKMKENEQLVKQVLYDTQNKIRTGDIASESSLTEYSTKKLAELRQTYGGASVDTSARPLLTTPDKQAAWATITNDPSGTTLWTRYRADRKAFVDDVAAGRIDTRTPDGIRRVNAINRLLQEDKK